MPVLVTITRLGALLQVLFVESIELALKIKALLTLESDDVQVNIKSLADQAIAADDRAMALVNQWRAENGLAPLP